MIQFAETQHKPTLIALWKQCFPQDVETFVDFYFQEIFREEECLIAVENNQAVAFLQMIPYNIKTGNEIRPSAYLSGVMTHPDYRNRGYMKQLLQTSFDEMTKKGYHYAFLIPQEEKLFDVYAKFGFERAFPEMIPHPRLETLISKDYLHRFQILTAYDESELKKLYAQYNAFLTSYPSVVLKTERQFAAVLWDFFNEQGTLLVHERGMIFEKTDGKQVRIQSFSETTEIIDDLSCYKGMIKSLDGSVLPKAVYMIQMLD
jgi:predicted acetyltransferase